MSQDGRDAPAAPNLAYCQIAPVVGGPDGRTPQAQVTGFIMRPDGSLVDLGSGTVQFTVWLPFGYGESVSGLAAQVIPEVARGYAQPGLTAQVEFVPFV